MFFASVPADQETVQVHLPQSQHADWTSRNMEIKEYLWDGRWRVEIWADSAGPVDPVEVDLERYH